MKEKILAYLSNIETSYKVKIIYACESGSRSRGLASPDSDYDVRFIYVQTAAEYAGLLERYQENLLFKLDGSCDIVGWDLKKFLSLLGKSNPTVFEWAGSSEVYRTSDEWKMVLDIMPKYFSPNRTLYHYNSMAKKDFKVLNDKISGTTVAPVQVTPKEYLAALRPVLACRWILCHDTFPPDKFSQLCEYLTDDVRESIIDLVGKKHIGNNKLMPRNDKLDKFIESGIDFVTNAVKTREEQYPSDWNTLNDVFLKIIGLV